MDSLTEHFKYSNNIEKMFGCSNWTFQNIQTILEKYLDSLTDHFKYSNSNIQTILKKYLDSLTEHFKIFKQYLDSIIEHFKNSNNINKILGI